MPTPLPEHVPVLLSAVLAGLNLQPNQTAIDATLGGGGHTRAMLEAIAPQGRLLGLEADGRTIDIIRVALKSHGSRFVAVHGNFRELQRIAADHGFLNVDAILFDLGLSSIALGDPARGFSFQNDGPLDMRFDQTSQSSTAADLVNQKSVSELTELFRMYGEEPLAQRIADQIVLIRKQRPFSTTADLTDAIAAVKRRRGRIHPATQVFQALRIAVNDEYGALTAALPPALSLLKVGGHLAVITFHSGEDRLVKRWMKAVAANGQVRLDTILVIIAPRAEQLANPRARSAKLRLLTKLINQPTDLTPKT